MRGTGAVAGALLVAACTTSAPSAQAITATLREVAAATVHGTGDNGDDPAELWQTAELRPVELTCGFVSRWAVAEIEAAGGQARPVHTLTLDPWDDSNNGHTMMEVRLDGRWVLYDLDFGATFVHDGRPLDLIGWLDLVPSGDYDVVWIDDHPLQPDVEKLKDTYRRPAQWPLVEDNTGTYYPDDGSADADRVGSYADWYLPLDADEWQARFYPTSP